MAFLDTWDVLMLINKHELWRYTERLGWNPLATEAFAQATGGPVTLCRLPVEPRASAGLIYPEQNIAPGQIVAAVPRRAPSRVGAGVLVFMPASMALFAPMEQPRRSFFAQY
jgi:hypothetical protein